MFKRGVSPSFHYGRWAGIDINSGEGGKHKKLIIENAEYRVSYESSKTGGMDKLARTAFLSILPSGVLNRVSTKIICLGTL